MDLLFPSTARQLSESLGYRDVSRLGEGGYAEVYRAFDPKLQRAVALKLLMVHKPEHVERMFREARAQAKIRHPSICQIYEVGWLGSAPFIAMQLIEGVELGELIHTLDLEQKLDIAHKLCDALGAAHAQGLIHRDLKPANVMVEQDGRSLHPYLVDFGMVWEHDDQGLTDSGSILGTPRYMAPELLRGGPCEVRSDVYGLGVTFYELFAGRPAYPDPSTALMFSSVLDGDAPPIDEVRSDLPRDLAAVVATAMAKAPEQRYADAQALAEDLDNVRRGEPVEASLPSKAHRIWWRFSHHRISTRLSLLGLLIFLLIAAGLQWRAGLRLKYQAHYSSVARNIEDGYRSVLMSPKHDIRPDIEQLRRRQAELRGELLDRGSLAAAPIHYALGVSHLQLEASEDAERHLRNAWDLGFQAPQVALALGRLHAERYRLERAEIGPPTTAPRRRALAALEREHRQPALDFLGAALGTSSVPAAAIEAHLAWVEHDYDKALAQARQVRSHSPWQHEHLILEAEILHDQATRQGWAGDLEQGLDTLNQAVDLLQQARSQAPSDPAPPRELCRLLDSRLELLTADGIKVPLAEVADFYQAGVDACQTAIELNPDLGEPWMLLSDLYVSWAGILAWSGQGGAEPILDLALESARRALETAPANLRFQQRVARAISHKAVNLTLRNSKDPALSELTEDGIRLLEASLRQHPDQIVGWTLLGGLLESKTHGLYHQGMDTIPTLLESCRALEKAVALDPEDYTSRYNVTLSYLQLLWDARALPSAEQRPLLEWQETASAHARKAVELRPESAWAHFALGSLNLEGGILALAEGLSPSSSWSLAFEHLHRSVELAPEGAFLLDNLLESLAEIGEVLLSLGYDPAPMIEASRRLLDERGDLLSSEQRGAAEIDLFWLSSLAGSVVGRPGPQSQRLPTWLGQLRDGEDTDHSRFGTYRAYRLFVDAVRDAAGARLKIDDLETLKAAIQASPKHEHWRLGLVAVLEAFAAADGESRRRALDDADRLLAADRLPHGRGQDVSFWIEAGRRLPEKGVVPFRLFETLQPWDEPFLRPALDRDSTSDDDGG